MQSSPGHRGNAPTPGWLCSCLDPPATSGSQILNGELSCEVRGAAPMVLLHFLPNCWGGCSGPCDSWLALLLPSLAKNPSHPIPVCCRAQGHCPSQALLAPQPRNKTRSQPICSECFQSQHLQHPRGPTHCSCAHLNIPLKYPPHSLSSPFKHSLPKRSHTVPLMII